MRGEELRTDENPPRPFPVTLGPALPERVSSGFSVGLLASRRARLEALVYVVVVIERSGSSVLGGIRTDQPG
jgi:hypothetical protein